MKSLKENEWRVTYNGSFWSDRGRAGKEIPIGKTFQWGAHLWHVPAVYTCGEGLVVDFCIEVEPEEIKAFLDKWYPILQENPRLPEALRREMDAENPTELPYFHAKMTINGKTRMFEHGYGITWIPESCFPEPMGDRIEAKSVAEHYGLDKNRGWIFHRAAFPWATKHKPDIRHLSLTLVQQPQRIYGQQFPTPELGEKLHFTHPLTGTEHTLCVTNVEHSVTEKPVHFVNIEEWPSHHIAMEYTLSPDLTNQQFSIRDTVESDPPRMNPNPIHPSGAASIGIIGGSDGPTAIIYSHTSGSAPHVACSSLHFEPVEEVVWQLEFREKLLADISVILI